MPHLLFGYRDGARACSAADWAEDAKAAIAGVLAEGRLPILVGGTGLYIRTLLDGIAPVPEIDAKVRASVRLLSAAATHAALAKEDPESAARLHPQRHRPIASCAGGGPIDRNADWGVARITRRRGRGFAPY